MSHTPQELVEEFPAQTDLIHALKIANAHFARLADEYHDLNRQVHRAGTNVEPVDQMTETLMRKNRAALKDEVARMLAGV